MVSVVDQSVFDKTLQEIRSGKSGTSYVLCGHVTFTDYKTIHVVRYGKPPEASLKDLAYHLDDGQVMYALLRLPLDGKMKLIYVHWLGYNVLRSKKMHYEDVHSEIVKQFGQFDVEIRVEDSAELTEEYIRNKIMNPGQETDVDTHM